MRFRLRGFKLFVAADVWPRPCVAHQYTHRNVMHLALFKDPSMVNMHCFNIVRYRTTATAFINHARPSQKTIRDGMIQKPPARQQSSHFLLLL